MRKYRITTGHGESELMCDADEVATEIAEYDEVVDKLNAEIAELVEMLDYYVLCDQKLMGTLYEKEEEALRLIKKHKEG